MEFLRSFLTRHLAGGVVNCPLFSQARGRSSKKVFAFMVSMKKPEYKGRSLIPHVKLKNTYSLHLIILTNFTFAPLPVT